MRGQNYRHHRIRERPACSDHPPPARHSRSAQAVRVRSGPRISDSGDSTKADQRLVAPHGKAALTENPRQTRWRNSRLPSSGSMIQPRARFAPPAKGPASSDRIAAPGVNLPLAPSIHDPLRRKGTASVTMFAQLLARGRAWRGAASRPTSRPRLGHDRLGAAHSAPLNPS